MNLRNLAVKQNANNIRLINNNNNTITRLNYYYNYIHLFLMEQNKL